jgi:hypothetical protein
VTERCSGDFFVETDEEEREIADFCDHNELENSLVLLGGFCFLATLGFFLISIGLIPYRRPRPSVRRIWTIFSAAIAATLLGVALFCRYPREVQMWSGWAAATLLGVVSDLAFVAAARCICLRAARSSSWIKLGLLLVLSALVTAGTVECPYLALVVSERCIAMTMPRPQ